MSNYTIAVNWAGKDALLDSDANKVISGDDFNTEFTTVRAALNSKADVNGSASENFVCNVLTADSGTVNGETIVTLATPQTFTKAHPTAAETIALSSNQVANLLNSDTFVVNVQGDAYTLSVSNQTAGAKADFIIKNQGAYDIAFDSVFKFNGGEPTITSGSGKVDLIHCISDGTTMYCTMTTDLT